MCLSLSQRSSTSSGGPEPAGGDKRFSGSNFLGSKAYEQAVWLSQTCYVKLLLRNRFLRGVSKRLLTDAPTVEFERLRSEISVLQADLTAQNMRFSFMRPDAKEHLFVASLVLATYRALLTRVSEESKAVEIVQGAFMEQLDVFYGLVVRLYIAKKDDELLQLEAALKTHTRVMGESFDVTFARSPSGFSATVKKCFFNDFFAANRSSFLMGPVFCTADNMWKAVLPPAQHIQYRRPTTLAAGGKNCHFIFKCKETTEEKDKAKKELRLGVSGHF